MKYEDFMKRIDPYKQDILEDIDEILFNNGKIMRIDHSSEIYKLEGKYIKQLKGEYAAIGGIIQNINQVSNDGRNAYVPRGSGFIIAPIGIAPEIGDTFVVFDKDGKIIQESIIIGIEANLISIVLTLSEPIPFFSATKYGFYKKRLVNENTFINTKYFPEQFVNFKVHKSQNNKFIRKYNQFKIKKIKLMR